jgi:hypothetical protein
MAASWSSDPPEAQAVRDLELLLSDPGTWPTLGPERLGHLLFYACLSYGLRPDPGDPEPLLRLHRDACSMLPPSIRLGLVGQLSSSVERVMRRDGAEIRAAAPNALLPFVVQDPDPAVVCAAAASYAALAQEETDDELEGPRAVAALAAERSDDEGKAGLVGGLLQLGDSRLSTVVAGQWRWLGFDGRQSLALLIQSFHRVTMLTVTFLLEWLEGVSEAPESPEYGTVAATLGRVGRHALEHGVVDLRCALPATRVPPEDGVRVIREWTGEEVAPLVASRLRAVSAVHASSLLAGVASLWGLQAEACELGLAAVREQVEVDNPGRPRARVSDPVMLPAVPPWERHNDSAIEWGILNPLGPTIHTLHLVPFGSEGVLALVHTTYAPGRSAAWVIATCDVMTPLRAVLVEAFDRNGADDHFLFRTLPDYVLVGSQMGVAARDLAELFARALIAIGAGSGAARAAERRASLLRADPWGTVEAEVHGAAGEASQVDGIPSSGEAEALTEVADAVGRWLMLAAENGHAARIREEIPLAWERAQENRE